MIDDMVVTNMTARLMAKAGLVCFEMAIKEHKPKNLDRITLLMKTADMNMVRNAAMFIFFFPLTD